MPDINPDLDLTFLYEIADGSDEFIVESIQVFLEQSPLILQEMGDAMMQVTGRPRHTAAHSIKGNLGFFGMLTSQALLVEIEGACKAGGQNPPDIIAKFGELAEVIDQSFIKLEAIKAEKEG